MVNGSRKWTLLFASISISILALVFILLFSPYRVTPATFEAIGEVNPLFLALALGMHISAWLVWSFRMKLMSDFLCGAHTDGDLRLSQSLKIILASLFAACITPSQFGGEPVRIYLLRRSGLTVGDGTAIVFGERSLDFMVVMIGGAISFILFRTVIPRYSAIFTAIGIILILGVLLMVYGITRPDKLKRFIDWVFIKMRVHKMERIRDKVYQELENFHEAHKKFQREGKKTIRLALLLTIAFWFVEFTIPSFLLLGLGVDPVWIYSIAAQFILVIIAAMPVSPGSSGVSELSSAYLYHTLVSTPLLGIFTLLWRLSTYYTSLIVGAITGMKVISEM
ncbi:MAG: flippase-like domain-containing protein [Methanophagales archaeon]|nr:flippase-like domain-containing protein [Methanophagales archaeon]